MKQLLRLSGYLAGATGIAVCAVAAVYRMGGNYTLANVQLGTLFQAGIAAMVLACLLQLYSQEG